MGKPAPFGSPATKALIQAFTFPAVQAQGRGKESAGASLQSLNYHSLSFLGASDFSALGFHKQKNDLLVPTGQENNDNAADYGLLSTNWAHSAHYLISSL